MAANSFFRKGRSGGAVNDLDGINGSELVGEEIAFVYETGSPGTLFFYELNATSGAADDGVNVISPDANPGDKRWLLQRIYSQANITVSADEPENPVTNDLWVDIS